MQVTILYTRRKSDSKYSCSSNGSDSVVVKVIVFEVSRVERCSVSVDE